LQDGETICCCSRTEPVFTRLDVFGFSDDIVLREAASFVSFRDPFVRFLGRHDILWARLAAWNMVSCALFHC
jgi:hypothetical protein